MKREVDAWGRVIFAGADAIELLLRGCDIADLLMTPDETLTQYNQLCASRNKGAHQVSEIATPTETPAEARQRQLATWLVPDAYRELPVRDTLLARCHHAVEIDRVNAEMDMFEERGWLPVLRLMFYLVDDWRARGVVWGVGRGSSVASYCLFLIGIHKCDSIAYDLSISEFLK